MPISLWLRYDGEWHITQPFYSPTHESKTQQPLSYLLHVISQLYEARTLLYTAFTLLVNRTRNHCRLELPFQLLYTSSYPCYHPFYDFTHKRTYSRKNEHQTMSIEKLLPATLVHLLLPPHMWSMDERRDSKMDGGDWDLFSLSSLFSLQFHTWEKFGSILNESLI